MPKSVAQLKVCHAAPLCERIFQNTRYLFIKIDNRMQAVAHAWVRNLFIFDTAIFARFSTKLIFVRATCPNHST